MHPYWIQKIEESRKTSVTKFWVVIVLIIVLPLLLVMKHDHFMILGVLCFAGAGLRLYWLGRDLPSTPKDQLPASADLTHQTETQVPTQWPSNTNPNIFGSPQAHSAFASAPVPHMGVQTHPFPEQAQVVSGQYVTEAQPQIAGGVPTQFPNGLPPNPFPQSQQSVPPLTGEEELSRTQSGIETAAPQRPLHFHDMAR